MNREILDEFKKFQDTYPEELKNKISPANVIQLMKWSWEHGRRELSREMRLDLENEQE